MKKIILFFIILHFPLVIYGKNYLCIGEIRTGLKKQQNGEWKSVRFEEKKYLISFENNSLKSVKNFGSDINICYEFRNSQRYNTSQCLSGNFGRIIEDVTWWYFWGVLILVGGYCFILLFLSSILISSLIIFF